MTVSGAAGAGLAVTVKLASPPSVMPLPAVMLISGGVPWSSSMMFMVCLDRSSAMVTPSPTGLAMMNTKVSVSSATSSSIVSTVTVSFWLPAGMTIRWGRVA